jgi:hypothetical protein
MADSDAAPPTPPPEVVPPAEEHPAAPDSAAAAAQEEAALGEVDHKRKLEEVSADAEANGDGEDAKRPRVDGETDAPAGGSLTPPPLSSIFSIRICASALCACALLLLTEAFSYSDRFARSLSLDWDQGLSSRTMGPLGTSRRLLLRRTEALLLPRWWWQMVIMARLRLLRSHSSLHRRQQLKLRIKKVLRWMHHRRHLAKSKCPIARYQSDGRLLSDSAYMYL